MLQTDYSQLIPELHYFVNRKCAPTWKIDRGPIDFHDLTFVYGGQSTYVVNGEEFKLQQGDFIYIPFGYVREAYTSSPEPMQCYAANFRLLGAQAAQEELALPFDRILRTNMVGEFVSLYSQLDHIWIEKAYNYEMRARAVLMLILDKLLCLMAAGLPMQHEDLRLLKIKQYILRNYTDKIEMSDLAEIAALNPVYLGAFFKQVNGCSIKQYINQIRINNAESLILTGGYSVSEAAMSSGFDDIFYFSKVYKNYKGYAPSILLKGKA